MSRCGFIEFEAAIAVARFRNFRVAAADLGMSPTALSSTIGDSKPELAFRSLAEQLEVLRLPQPEMRLSNEFRHLSQRKDMLPT
jgi:hypothetical protein